MKPDLNKNKIDPGSFRDPSGFVFHQNNAVYRQINKSYKKEYDLLLSSGVYKKLTDQNYLIPHQEIKITPPRPARAYKVIEYQPVKFISYPYEWSFSQLKDAALTTLEIQKTCLDYGLSLKDASAYNIQFIKGKPVFIDTLSFEKYQPGRPWVGYRQFCQHFLAPLALGAYTDIRLNQLMRTNIDGIPLDLASKLLPFKTKLNFSLLSHLHIHAKSQMKFSSRPESVKNAKGKMSETALRAVTANLQKAVKNLQWKNSNTEWGDYYNFTNYSKNGFRAKKELVKRYLHAAGPNIVWDLGANTGEFTRLVDKKVFTVSFDVDPAAVEKNYLEVKENKETNILPLWQDLTNPSPNLGWDNRERKSLINRGPADLVLALALIHHLSISNNLPFDKIAEYFSRVTEYLIIEFVPKSDSQVKKLLASREDIFDNYHQKEFENQFKNYFDILETDKIKDSDRILYLMKKI